MLNNTHRAVVFVEGPHQGVLNPPIRGRCKKKDQKRIQAKLF